jgi:hypothetical protein
MGTVARAALARPTTAAAAALAAATAAVQAPRRRAAAAATSRRPGAAVVAAAGSAVVAVALAAVVSTASFSQAPEVVISYTPLTANDLAAKLVRDSTGKGPGKPLENEAAAIQAAVSAGNKATVCADIIDYLGLVKAQTNKKVTVAEGTLLTTDATDLANAVGC